MSFLMYARPALLVTIIVLTGPVVRSIVFADEERLDLWLVLVVAMAAFVFVSLAGRGRPNPASALLAEGIIATVFFLMPPLQWSRWFGMNGFVDASGGTLGAFGLMQPLAAMWLGIVVVTALAQRKRQAVTLN